MSLEFPDSPAPTQRERDAAKLKDLATRGYLSPDTADEVRAIADRIDRAEGYPES